MTFPDLIKRAQQDLDSKVEEFMRVNEWPGVLTSYVLVAHLAMPPDDDGCDISSYAMAFRDGSAPDHVAEGLLHMGIRRIRDDAARAAD